VAIGTFKRRPQVNSDGSITQQTEVVLPDGSVSTINQEIIEQGTPVTGVEHVIADISDQADYGVYTYNLPSSANTAISRIFLNGVNVTFDGEFSEDGNTFTFSEDYNPEEFLNVKIIVDYQRR